MSQLSLFEVPTRQHPAKYSAVVMAQLRSIAAREAARLGRPLRILDGFAGTGRIHRLRADGHRTVGVELEWEWAVYRRGTARGDALRLPFRAGIFDAYMASPAYGDRHADHHEAKDPSKRHTYRHYLDQPLSLGSSAALQWGPEYQAFHEAAWAEAVRVVRPGGLVVVVIADHIRGGEEIDVVGWHRSALEAVGLITEDDRTVPKRGLRHGANAELRVDEEHVLVCRRRNKPV